MTSSPAPLSDAPPAPAADPALAEFERAWEDFFGAIRRARGRAAREQPDGLSLSQLNLVRPLAEGAVTATVGELAEQAGVAPPTATRMLDCLERAGLVHRAQATHDRRVVAVSLTGEGRGAVAAKRDAVVARRRELFAGLADDERAHAAHLLRSMAGMLESL